ncbi:MULTISPECIES: helix-turn-helix domain-containing protein [Streptomyces]|uniref:helix-turn-helix domain-containing protein n=1 Tax=Streptomyces TaxID=1883 RepID=UPI001487846C|nr:MULTISPECIES: helix-turn-helix domain-containing protein [Streptomyces]
MGARFRVRRAGLASGCSSQAQLAERAGLTQAKISRLEGADTVPTLPLLRRLALAMDSTLNIALDDDREEVAFVAHTAA